MATPVPELTHARIGRLLVVGGLLLALWGLSLGLSYVPFGVLALPIALGIALAKAVLVVSYFMELFRQRASVGFAFGVALLMVALLLMFVMTDVMTRLT